jgi:hypothetical protein
MNDQQKLNINTAVTQYIRTKAEAISGSLSELISSTEPKLAYWSSSTFMANNTTSRSCSMRCTRFAECRRK